MTLVGSDFKFTSFLFCQLYTDNFKGPINTKQHHHKFYGQSICAPMGKLVRAAALMLHRYLEAAQTDGTTDQQIPSW